MSHDQLAASATRPATETEVAALRAAIKPLPSSEETDLAVVFCYPGIGVGEHHPQLAGCTAQLLQVNAARSALEPLGVGVFTLSTEPEERREHLTHAVRAVAGRVDLEQAAALPHVDVAGEVYLERATFVLDAGGRDTAITGITDSAEHVGRVIDLLVARRLATFGASAGEPPPAGVGRVAQEAGATGHRLLPRGADSVGIVRFGDDPARVCKIGPSEVVAPEAEHLVRINALAAATEQAAVFPKVLGVLPLGARTALVMEGLEDVGLEGQVFSDTAGWVLADTCLEALRPYLSALRAVYEASRTTGASPVARYLSGPRARVLSEHPLVAATLETLVPGLALADLVGREVLLPNGQRTPSLRELLAWLESSDAPAAPDWSTQIHGDLHLKNMLHHRDGRPALIDPRLVWDGQVGDAGRGDPIFDVGSLLHSLRPMTAVLAAVGAADMSALGDSEAATRRAGVLDLTGLVDHFRLDVRLEEVLTEMVDRLPGAGSGDRRAAAYVAAANALLGWLKYPDALQDRTAFLTVFGHAVWYLELARRGVPADA